MGVERFFSNMEIGKKKIQIPSDIELLIEKRAQEKCRNVYRAIVVKLTK